MGGFNTVTGGIPDDAGATLAAGMRKRGLLSTLMGVGADPRSADPRSADPGAQPAQPVASGDHRFEDDKTKSPYGDTQSFTPPDVASQDRPAGDFASQAPQMAQASRASLAQQMQQPAQPVSDPFDEPIKQLQGRLSTLVNPPPQPERSLKSKIFGALGGFAQGFGNPGYAQGVRQQQNFQQNQRREQETSLQDQIDKLYGSRATEQTADKRMTLQQQMQEQAETERQSAQQRQFTQQDQIQKQAETARQAQATQAQQASDARLDKTQQASDARLSTTIQAEGQRQRAGFSEAEKLIPLREESKAKGAKATADEERRADLGRNMNENLDQLEEIVNRRPDLFGPMGGRKVMAQQNQSFWNPFAGTKDPDIAKLKAIREYFGMASVGTHAMRNAQHVGVAADAVVSGFLNSPEATKQAIGVARQSVGTFLADRDMGGGAAAAKAANGAKLKDRVSGRVLVEGKDF